MKQLVLSISDEKLKKLETLSEEMGVSKEKLAEFGIDGLFNKLDESFEKTRDYLLEKNKELYERLS